MLYAIRNAKGHIISLSETPVADSDPVSLKDEEVLHFLSIGSDELDSGDYLENSDAGIARILEDLIDVLIDKNIIMFTDLPAPAQKKLLSRKLVRSSQNPDSEPSQAAANTSFLIEDDESF